MGKRSSLSYEAIDNVPVWAVLISLLATNAFEEILMRGYLLGRLRELLGSRWLPVVITSIAFGLWHLYQGPLGAINATLGGALLGTAYVLIGRLWPIIAAHFLYDAGLYWMFFEQLHRHPR
jgi:membrane protease YdiL (CAAX protease family)